MPAPRALFVKLSSLGDVIHHFPAITDLGAHRPEIDIDWAVEEAYAPLVRLHPGVREAIAVNFRRLKAKPLSVSAWATLSRTRRELRRRPYDYIVDSQGLIKSAAVARLARGPVFGFDRASAREKAASRFYDVGLAIAKKLHAVERNRLLAGSVFGYVPAGPPDYGLGEVASPPEWAPKGDFVVALHASSRADKRWPDERWTALASRLADDGIVVIYPGGSPREREDAARLAAASPGAIAAPTLSLAQAAALLASASGVVGVDTGLTHLAVALGCPTVGLYVATEPGLTGLCGGPRAVNLGGPGRVPGVEEVVQVLLGTPPRLMARFLYSILLWVALPFALARLAWRARRQPGYVARLRERFGTLDIPAGGPLIWVHAVSVGETRAAAPLIAALRERHPHARILLTHMTPTGYQTGLELFGDSVLRAWLPYDHSFAVRRFLARARPAFGLILETEIWPNLLAHCAASGVPVFLVNARLSPRSAARYARAAALVREALGHLAGIAAQTAGDATRLAALGAREVVVTGNIKFDLEVPADVLQRAGEMRAMFGAGRRIWVVGSTRDGEEELIAEALAQTTLPADVLIVIVPRHPQRFAEVNALLVARGEAPMRRSLGQKVPSTVRYVVGDTMGEMLAYYGCADVVLVGGSLLPFGGQNLIEACAMGRPVIFGPHTFNFEQAAQEAIARGAGLRSRDAREAVAMAMALLEDAPRRREMGARARAFAEANRGALGRLLGWLETRATLNRGPAPG